MKQLQCSDLLKIARLAVEHSGGRVRLVQSSEGNRLEFDGLRQGAVLEYYVELGQVGGADALALYCFEMEVLRLLKRELPELYRRVKEALLPLVMSCIPDDTSEEIRKELSETFWLE